MGSNGSKFVKKIVSPFNSSGASGSSNPESGSCSSVKAPGPIVLSRQGSMFFDEDGDLAHEFYVEELPAKRGSKAKMKRVVNNLKPQGEVAYTCPRLHSDFPVILYQVDS